MGVPALLSSVRQRVKCVGSVNVWKKVRCSNIRVWGVPSWLSWTEKTLRCRTTSQFFLALAKLTGVAFENWRRLMKLRSIRFVREQWYALYCYAMMCAGISVKVNCAEWLVVWQLWQTPFKEVRWRCWTDLSVEICLLSVVVSLCLKEQTAFELFNVFFFS